MSTLDRNWTPEFGTIFTWFAMDKHGRIAVMVNNCFGNLPDALLAIADVESLLDQLTDYLWEESPLFSVYPQNKQGNTTLDLYPASQFIHMQNRQQVEQWIKQRSGYQHKISEYNYKNICNGAGCINQAQRF